MIYRVFYIPGGAGCLPATVSYIVLWSVYYWVVFNDLCFLSAILSQVVALLIWAFFVLL